MGSYSRTPKRFAPLNEALGNPHNAPRLRGVVFDVDGTLCKPQSYMFKQMRAALKISPGTDILEHVHSLPEPAQTAAFDSIRSIESAAMIEQVPQPGLDELISYIERQQPTLPMGICTRNFDGPVDHLLKTFLPGKKFDPIITRAFKPPKPSPEGILHIARTWGLEDRGDSLIMVGDSIDDMLAGHRAGAATVLLVNEGNVELKEHESTGACIDRLDDLVKMLEDGFEERSR